MKTRTSLIVAIMLSLSVLGAGQPVPQSVIVRVMASTVTICNADGMPIGGGFVIAPGYVVAAKHVATAPNDVISVKLYGRSKLEAPTGYIQVSGLDLTIIKVRTYDAPPVVVGNSDNCAPGDEVFAVGCPYGLLESVTKGVIASYRRISVNVGSEDDTGVVNYRNMILTHGVIEPGDSGGPLVNARGEVIGVNLLGMQSMGLSQPLNDIRDLLVASCR